MNILTSILPFTLVAAIPASNDNQDKAIVDLDMSFGRRLTTKNHADSKSGALVDQGIDISPIANFHLQVIPLQ
ncbi:hypothetical protein DSO57_1009859 [Entomophthora muscae]|uniref:Uncharacterized protein n=1 Tax=Entomophthora muscae TaxID=34485 RepID=A0ACC2SJE2_9FUNG|nr:hypothetical protein DSO57_1009859 [Entomophthora muscae]